MKLSGPLGVLKLPKRDEVTAPSDPDKGSWKGIFISRDAEEMVQRFGHQHSSPGGRHSTPVSKDDVYDPPSPKGSSLPQNHTTDIFYPPIRIMNEDPE